MIEQCVYCQSVYESKQSTAKLTDVFCGQRCEKDFYEDIESPIEFVEED